MKLSELIRRYRWTLSGMGFVWVSLLSGCGNSGNPGSAGPGISDIVIPVEIARVVRQDIAETTELSGTVRSRHRVEIASEIQGIVLENTRLDGDSFQKGDLLVELDRRDFQIGLQIAEARLAQSEENLKELLIGTRPEIIEQYRAAVEKQNASLKDAELNFQRTKTLFEKSVRTQSQMEEAQYAKDEAAALLAEAQARLEQAINGPTAEEIAAAKASVTAQKAEVRQAQRQLEKTRILAPFDGIVAKRLVEKGAYVNPGTRLLDLVSTGEMDIYFDVPERLIGNLKVGSSLQILSDTYPDLYLELPVVAIMPAADERSRNIPVRCTLPSESPLKPGMLVRIIMEIGRRENVLVIPQDAVQQEKGSSIVYLAKNDTAQVVSIKTGLQTANLIEISGQIQEGDSVIILGNEIVFPGVKIQISGQGKPPEEAPGTPAASKE